MTLHWGFKEEDPSYDDSLYLAVYPQPKFGTGYAWDVSLKVDEDGIHFKAYPYCCTPCEVWVAQDEACTVLGLIDPEWGVTYDRPEGLKNFTIDEGPFEGQSLMHVFEEALFGAVNRAETDHSRLWWVMKRTKGYSKAEINKFEIMHHFCGGEDDEWLSK